LLPTNQIADDVLPPLLPRESSEFIMQGGIIPARTAPFGFRDESSAFGGEAFRTSANVPSLDPDIVLAEAGVRDATNAVVLAWTPGLGRVIVTGRRSENYIVIVANRREYADRTWGISHIQYKFTDRCLWFRGEREYGHPPTREDIVELLKQVRQHPHDFIFKSR